MDGIKSVEIDAEGTFKYILVTLTKKVEDVKVSKTIVRGYKWAGYHGMRIMVCCISV
jgi:hypothetical protein